MAWTRSAQQEWELYNMQLWWFDSAFDFFRHVSEDGSGIELCNG
jgi:hypothetical protein